MMTSLTRLFAAAGALVALTGTAPVPQDTAAMFDAPSLVDTDLVLLGLDTSMRLTVPVSIAGSPPYPFVIDTGAERTIVSHELARTLRLRPGPGVRILSMTGAMPTNSVHVPHLAMNQTRVDALVAPALAGRHIGAAGIIGLDSLQNKRVLLDFLAGTMAVQPAAVPEERWGPGTIVVRGRSLYGQLILTDAQFEGERVQVIVDTGAEMSIGNLALSRRLTRRRGDSPVDLMSVTGGTLTADQRQLALVRVGGVEFHNLPVAFADAPPFARLGLADRPALLLGMDALRMFERVSIDFAARRIRFLPPDGFGRPTMFDVRLNQPATRVRF